MIQRIQSLFLLLGILANLAILKVPVWSSQLENQAGTIHALGFEAEEANQSLQFFEHTDTGNRAFHSAFFALLILSSLLLLWAIFRFNNRGAQIRLCYIGIIAIFGEILMVVLLAQNGNAASPLPGFALPVLAILFAWLAARYIRKDDELVKSVDRIR